MLEAAREAVSFAHGHARADLDSDRQLALALVKAIEMIGEAASAVTESTRSESPEIPWRSIVAMRNRLVHGYFNINLEIVWQTVQQDLPPLISQLERIVSGDAGRD